MLCHGSLSMNLNNKVILEYVIFFKRMYLKIFPVYIDNTHHLFNSSEVLRIRGLFTRWEICDLKIFGPYEVLNFILLDPYEDGLSHKPYLAVIALDFLDIDIISYGLCVSVSGRRLSNCFFCFMPLSEYMGNLDVYISVVLPWRGGKNRL
ncbi:hypothetical protein CsSME_00038948 [Camellia sinensis var. sinensis]